MNSPAHCSTEQSGWRPIATAPKDGTKILLARHGYVADTTGMDEGSEEWKQRIWDQSKRRYCLWWACTGWRSEKWKNWNDGTEPAGLNEPTHWIPIPPLPEPPNE